MVVGIVWGWYDMVWYGMEWYGVEWGGMGLDGMAWDRKGWDGMGWDWMEDLQRIAWGVCEWVEMGRGRDEDGCHLSVGMG